MDNLQGKPKKISDCYSFYIALMINYHYGLYLDVPQEPYALMGQEFNLHPGVFQLTCT